MHIYFKSKELEKSASDVKRCVKKLGPVRAKLFMRRLAEMYRADTLEDVRNLPGHYHELVGDRKGQWACDLDNPYRLVFEPHERPIPTDSDGRSIWVEIKGVEIVEVVDYHGK